MFQTSLSISLQICSFSQAPTSGAADQPWTFLWPYPSQVCKAYGLSTWPSEHPSTRPLLLFPWPYPVPLSPAPASPGHPASVSPCTQQLKPKPNHGPLLLKTLPWLSSALKKEAKFPRWSFKDAYDMPMSTDNIIIIYLICKVPRTGPGQRKHHRITWQAL